MWKFLRNAANHVFGGIVGVATYLAFSWIIASVNVGAKVFGDFALEFRDFRNSNLPVPILSVPIGGFLMGILALGEFVLKTFVIEMPRLFLRGSYQGAKDGLSHLGIHLKEDWRGTDDTADDTTEFYENRRSSFGENTGKVVRRSKQSEGFSEPRGTVLDSESRFDIFDDFHRRGTKASTSTVGTPEVPATPETKPPSIS